MCLITECHTKYLGLFSERWIDNINTSNNSEIREAFQKINQFYEDSFLLLSKSILAGEYISDNNLCNEIKTFIENLSDVDFSNEDNDIGKLYQAFISLNNNLFNSLRYYQNLIEISNNKIDSSNNAKKLFSSIKLKSESSKDNHLINFCKIVVPICTYDYRFPIRNNSLIELFQQKDIIEELINKVKGNDELTRIYDILLNKCKFFIKKTRKKNIYFSSNNLSGSVNPREINVGSLQIFIDKEKNPILSDKELAILLEDIKKEKPKLESFVRIIRHYKESLSSYSEIKRMDDVISCFDEYYDSLKISGTINEKIKEYNNFALDTIRNYIYNCRFSFISKFDEVPFCIIEENLEKIKNIQISGVKNFHPFEKGIECLIKRIENLLAKDILHVANIRIEELLDIKIKKLKELISSYEDAIKWCEYRKFYPFLLPFEESIIIDYNLSIFVPSTFSRVIDYSEQFAYLNESKQKEREIRIARINFKTSNKTRVLEETVRRSEKRTYELLALFTGIITFLFGVVNIFTGNNNSDFMLLITNTMGFGLLLLLFVSLILLITPIFLLEIPFSIYKKTLRFKCLLILFPLYVILIAISFLNSPLSNSKEEIKAPKESPILNQITIPISNSNFDTKDTMFIRNKNTVIIYEDSIAVH